MAEILNIDTTELKELCTSLGAVNAEIDEAVTWLQSVRAHNDWNCYERTVINDYIQENNRRILALKENGDAFFHAVSTVSDLFVEKENGISARFSSVEGLIRQITSVVSLGAGASVPHAFSGVSAPSVSAIGSTGHPTITVAGASSWEPVPHVLSASTDELLSGCASVPMTDTEISSFGEALTTCDLSSLDM